MLEGSHAHGCARSVYGSAADGLTGILCYFIVAGIIIAGLNHISSETFENIARRKLVDT